MYATTVELVDARAERVGIGFVTAGRAILCLMGRDRWASKKVTKMSVRVDPESITVITLGGRRLVCAGAQKIGMRGKAGQRIWRPARELSPGDVVYALDGGILTVDRISCVVQADKPGEPWITVATEGRNVFAEEILCRA